MFFFEKKNQKTFDRWDGARSKPAGSLSAVLAGTLLLVAGGCTGPSCLLPGQQHMNIVSLYFGRDIAGHGMVSDAQWSRFAADVIGPAFPDGFTSFDATGQWRNPTTGAIEREPTKVVQIATQVSSNIRAGVDAVASAYKKQFQQLSVGVVSTTACASF